MKKFYRPDIDGLRALSIISVLIYHLQFNYNDTLILKGGFIGVDIFFVISGYLIGALIFREYKEKNQIFLRVFYERRIRRILPVLLLTMIFTIIGGWFLLLPSNNYTIGLKDLSIQQLFSLLFVSNIYFWNLSQRYGEPESFLNPFLHTWSLSIEEQFYILFPLVCLILYKFPKKFIFNFFLFGFLFSLLITQYASTKYISAIFYLIPFRAWEILAGILLAYREIFYERDVKNNKFHSILLVVGLFLVIFSFFFFDDKFISVFKYKFHHPSIVSTIPIIGTCLIIWFGNKNFLITKFLSKKILINIGLISYSLYLWHYPIINFFRIISDFDKTYIKFSIVIISVVFSIISYYFFEKRLRDRKKLSFKKFNIIILPLIGFILFFNFFSIKNNGYENRLKLSNFQKKILTNDNFQVDNLIFNEENNKKNILIVGNSHAKDFFRSIKQNKKLSKGYTFSLIHTQLDCLKSSVKLNINTCSGKRQEIKNNNEYSKIFNSSDIIIIKSRWMVRDLHSLESSIDFLLEENKKIILISSNPEFETDNSYSIKKNEKKNLTLLKKIYYGNLPIIDKFILTYDKKPNDLEKKIIQKNYYLNLKNNKIDEDIKNKLYNFNFINKDFKKNKITYVNYSKYFCDFKNQTCDFSYLGEKIFKDNSGHLTKNGIEFINKIFINKDLTKLIKEKY